MQEHLRRDDIHFFLEIALHARNIGRRKMCGRPRDIGSVLLLAHKSCCRRRVIAEDPNDNTGVGEGCTGHDRIGSDGRDDDAQTAIGGGAGVVICAPSERGVS